MSQDASSWVASVLFRAGWAPEGWLRADDAAARLGIGRERLRQLAAAGCLRRRRFAGCRAFLYHARDVARVAALRRRPRVGPGRPANRGVHGVVPAPPPGLRRTGPF